MTGLVYQKMSTPLGDLLVTTDGQGICHVLFAHETPSEPRLAAARCADHPLVQLAKDQLSEYFAGARRAFDLPLNAAGTAFQMRVWAALCTIPFGQTWHYAQLAQAIGSPTATRAVGLANGRNPLGIVVPCHRVVGKNGAFTGYAGGLARKRWLLEHEGALEPSLF